MNRYFLHAENSVIVDRLDPDGSWCRWSDVEAEFARLRDVELLARALVCEASWHGSFVRLRGTVCKDFPTRLDARGLPILTDELRKALEDVL